VLKSLLLFLTLFAFKSARIHEIRGWPLLLPLLLPSFAFAFKIRLYPSNPFHPC